MASSRSPRIWQQAERLRRAADRPLIQYLALKGYAVLEAAIGIEGGFSNGAVQLKKSAKAMHIAIHWKGKQDFVWTFDQIKNAK